MEKVKAGRTTWAAGCTLHGRDRRLPIFDVVAQPKLQLETFISVSLFIKNRRLPPKSTFAARVLLCAAQAYSASSMPRKWLEEATLEEGMELISNAFATLGPAWAGSDGHIMHLPLTGPDGQVMQAPARGKCCLHVACFDAVRDWAASGRRCPICGADLGGPDNLQVDALVYTLINLDVVRDAGVKVSNSHSGQPA